MKLLKLSLCAAVASVGLGSAAFAATPSVTFNAGVASNYLFRGLSQTAGKVEGFGGADLAYGPVYAGVWTSNVDFAGNGGGPDTTSIEADFYGGIAPVYKNVTFTLGGIYYTYWNQPNWPTGTDNYFELKAGASTTVGKWGMGVQYFHSWEFPLKTGAANYYEGDLSYAVTPKATVSGAFGYQDLDKVKFGLDHYTTWNIGVTYALTDHLSVDGRYTGVSDSAKAFFGTGQNGPFNAGDRIVGTLKATF